MQLQTLGNQNQAGLDDRGRDKRGDAYAFNCDTADGKAIRTADDPWLENYFEHHADNDGAENGFSTNERYVDPRGRDTLNSDDSHYIVRDVMTCMMVNMESRDRRTQVSGVSRVADEGLMKAKAAQGSADKAQADLDYALDGESAHNKDALENTSVVLSKEQLDIKRRLDTAEDDVDTVQADVDTAQSDADEAARIVRIAKKRAEDITRALVGGNVLQTGDTEAALCVELDRTQCPGSKAPIEADSIVGKLDAAIDSNTDAINGIITRDLPKIRDDVAGAVETAESAEAIAERAEDTAGAAKTVADSAVSTANEVKKLITGETSDCFGNTQESKNSVITRPGGMFDSTKRIEEQI